MRTSKRSVRLTRNHIHLSWLAAKRLLHSHMGNQMQERRGRRLWCREQAFGKGLGLGQMSIWKARIGASMSSDDRFGSCCGARARCRHVHARSGSRACYTFDMPATPATLLCRGLILMYSQRHFAFLAHISKLQMNAKARMKPHPLQFAHHAQAVVGEVGREVAGEPKHVSGTKSHRISLAGTPSTTAGMRLLIANRASLKMLIRYRLQACIQDSCHAKCRCACSVGSHTERADAPSDTIRCLGTSPLIWQGLAINGMQRRARYAVLSRVLVSST